MERLEQLRKGITSALTKRSFLNAAGLVRADVEQQIATEQFDAMVGELDQLAETGSCNYTDGRIDCRDAICVSKSTSPSWRTSRPGDGSSIAVSTSGGYYSRISACRIAITARNLKKMPVRLIFERVVRDRTTGGRPIG